MPDYDIVAMKQAIKQCDANILVFEEAIKKEIETKMQYKKILRDLQQKAQ